MTAENEALIRSCYQEDAKTVQSIGRIAEATLKHIHGFDVADYTPMELTNCIEALTAVRMARLQKRLGIA